MIADQFNHPPMDYALAWGLVLGILSVGSLLVNAAVCGRDSFLFKVIENYLEHRKEVHKIKAEKKNINNIL